MAAEVVKDPLAVTPAALPAGSAVYDSAERKSAEEEEQSADTFSRQMALERCEELINWYDRSSRHQRRLIYTMHTAAILLSGITPVLVVLQLALGTDSQYRLVLLVLTALFPAIAAMITALDGAYKWRDNWMRFSQAQAELKSEKIKYLTRAGKYYHRRLSEAAALANFVNRVEMISLEETAGWRMSFEQRENLEILTHQARGERGEEN